VRVRVLLEYEGTKYHGWQVQPAKRTVQEAVEAAILAVTGEAVRVRPAGRTDAGVHARGQVADFRLAREDFPPAKLLRALNAVLPPDVAILKCEAAPEGFSAQMSARAKTYVYSLLNRRERAALDRRFLAHHGGALDLAAMREAAAFLLGEHDFSAFRAADCTSTRPVQTVARLDVERDAEGVIRFTITATGFLKHMVRAIVGTLVWVGEGRLLPSAVKEILDSRDRTRAGPTVPAAGLVLEHVRYDDGFGDRPVGR
jgi:tRNA pseudouridine38-40 synthase